MIRLRGADLLLALTLYVMNMRGARAPEAIVLTDEALTTTRTTPGGRKNDERQIVSLALGDSEQPDLAGALTAAIARMQSPRFDNPQTRP